MIVRAYSVYDVKATYFSPPFFCKKDAEAVRMFSDACQDRTTMLSRHPQDFSLYCIGVFDDHSGELDKLQHTFLCRGSDCTSQVEEDPFEPPI